MISEIMPEAGDKELVKIDKEKLVTVVNNLKQMKPQTKFFGTFFLYFSEGKIFFQKSCRPLWKLEIRSWKYGSIVEQWVVGRTRIRI